MNLLFPLVALGGVAALFFASSSSASTLAKRGPVGGSGGGGEGPFCENLIEMIAKGNPGFKAIMAKKDYQKAASILDVMADDALKEGLQSYAKKYKGCANYLRSKPGAVTPDIELTEITTPGGGKVTVPTSEVGWVADENAINSAQICLVNLGFLENSGEVDGKLGPKTKAALLAFQKKYSLKQQTGELTRETAELVCTKVDKSAYDTAEGERWKIKGSDKETETSAYNLGYEAGQADKAAGVAQNMAWGHDTFASLGANIQAAGQTGYTAGYTGVAKIYAGGKGTGADLGYGTGPDTTGRAAEAQTKGYAAGVADADSGKDQNASASFAASDFALADAAAYKKAYDEGYIAASIKAAKDQGAADGKADKLAGNAANSDAAFNKLGWDRARWFSYYSAAYNTAYETTAVAGLPSMVRYDAYGRPIVQRITIADLYPRAIGHDGRPVSNGPGRRPEPRR